MIGHPVRALGALFLRAAPLRRMRMPCRRRRFAQMTDALILARRALIASRPLRPHLADLAAHLRVVDEIDRTLCNPGYRSGRDFFAMQDRALKIALQREHEHDLTTERAKGFDGWIGNLDRAP